jgi:hypothetical protein
MLHPTKCPDCGVPYLSRRIVDGKQLVGCRHCGWGDDLPALSPKAKVDALTAIGKPPPRKRRIKPRKPRPPVPRPSFISPPWNKSDEQREMDRLHAEADREEIERDNRIIANLHLIRLLREGVRDEEALFAAEERNSAQILFGHGAYREAPFHAPVRSSEIDRENEILRAA